MKTRHRTPLLLLAALSTALAACSTQASTTPSSASPQATLKQATSLPNASDITLVPNRPVDEGVTEAVDRASRGAVLPADMKFLLPQLETFPVYVKQAGYWDTVTPVKETSITVLPSALSWADGSLGGAARSWTFASSVRPEKYTLTITALLFEDAFASSKAVATMRDTHSQADKAGVFSFGSGKDTLTVGLAAPSKVLVYVELKGPDSVYEVRNAVETLSQFLEKSIQEFMVTLPAEEAPSSGTSSSVPTTQKP